MQWFHCYKVKTVTKQLCKKSKIWTLCGLIVLNVIVFVLFSIGTRDVLYNIGVDNCEHAHSLNNLVKIKLKEDLRNAYPKYSLYYYNESSRIKFHGVPAVFIHGHIGDFDNGIELASVTVEMAKTLGKKPFDFFTVGLNREMSAFYGKFLENQSRFVHECIKYILSLYTSPVDKSIVVVGHSMGGMVAMGLLKLPNFNPHSVAAVILLASPQEMPVATIERGLRTYYDNVHEAWKSKNKDDQVVLVSIGGGDRDILVRTGLTSLSQIGASNTSIWTSTTSVPLAWFSVDHVAQLWCKQILSTISRALYELIDYKTNEISKNKSLIYNVMKHHLASNFGKNNYLPVLPGSSNLNLSIPWREVKLPWRMQNQQSNPSHIVVRLRNFSSEASLVMLTNVSSVNWIGGCNTSDDNICNSTNLLASRGFLLPSPSEVPLKAIHLSSEDLHYFNALVVSIPKSNLPVEVSIEMYVSRDQITYGVPSMFLFVKSETLTLNESPDGRSFYNITLDGFTGILQAYLAHIRLLSCKSPDFVVVKFYVPWGEPPIYYVIRNSEDINLKLISNQPSSKNSENPQLHIYIPSQCSLQIYLEPSIQQALGQITRHYIFFFPTFVVLEILMIMLNQQLFHIDIREKYRKLVSILICLINFFIIPIVVLWELLAESAGIPADDIGLLKAKKIWRPFSLLFLFFTVFLVAYLVTFLLKLIFHLFFKILSTLLKRLMILRKPMLFLHHCIPFVAMILGLSLCGTMGLLLMISFCFFMALIHCPVTQACERSNNLFDFCISLFCLSLCHFLLNFVTFFLWLQNDVKFAVHDDPSFVHCIVSTSSYFIINLVTHFSPPSISRLRFVILAALQVICFFLVTHAVVSLYMVSYFIDIVLGVFALQAIVEVLLRNSPIFHKEMRLIENPQEVVVIA